MSSPAGWLSSSSAAPTPLATAVPPGPVLGPGRASALSASLGGVAALRSLRVISFSTRGRCRLLSRPRVAESLRLLQRGKRNPGRWCLLEAIGSPKSLRLLQRGSSNQG